MGQSNTCNTTIALMHGTCLCRSAKIKEEGFNGNVYLTSNEALAWYYAECALDECESECGDYVVFSVHAEREGLRVDRNSFEEPLSYFRDEYTKSDLEWMEMLESGEIPSPENEFDYQTSLDVVNSVVCLSKITPSEISIME